MAQVTPWHLTSPALAVLASIDRPETDLVRDILSPSGTSRVCFVGPEVDALYAVLLCSEDARLGDCGARGVPFPEQVLAAMFGLPEGAFETADERLARFRLAADLAVALTPQQVAA